MTTIVTSTEPEATAAEFARLPTSTRRRVAGGLIALLSLLSLLAIPSGTASADQNWSSDGCSVVPDRGWHFSPHRLSWGYYDFNHACVHHDGCYRGHWASKGTCDWWFRNDMRASCRARHAWWSPQRGACYDRANIYYLGVVAFGQSAYDQRTSYIPMNAYA